MLVRRTDNRQAGLTFEFLYVKTHSGDNVSILELLGLEMIEQRALPAVIQSDHQHIALLLLQTEHGAQAIQETHTADNLKIPFRNSIAVQPFIKGFPRIVTIVCCP